MEIFWWKLHWQSFSVKVPAGGVGGGEKQDWVRAAAPNLNLLLWAFLELGVEGWGVGRPQSCPELRKRVGHAFKPLQVIPRRAVSLWARPGQGSSWGGSQL